MFSIKLILFCSCAFVGLLPVQVIGQQQHYEPYTVPAHQTNLPTRPHLQPLQHQNLAPAAQHHQASQYPLVSNQHNQQVASHPNAELWRDLHARVFASHQSSQASHWDRLSPEQTRDILRQLQDIYYGKYWKHLQAKNLQTSERWWVQLSKIVALLKVSQISSDKCYAQDFLETNRLIASWQQNDLNLVPYLFHYKGLQLEHCKQFANENLHSTIVSALSSDEVFKMDRLAKLVQHNMHQLRYRNQASQDTTSKAHLAQVLAKSVSDLFLEQQADEIGGSANARLLSNQYPVFNSQADFEQVYRQQVVGFCHKITETVDPVEYIAELEGSYPMLNEAGYDWVRYADICRDILKMSEDVSDQAYAMLSPQVPTTVLHQTNVEPVMLNQPQQAAMMQQPIQHQPANIMQQPIQHQPAAMMQHPVQHQPATMLQHPIQNQQAHVMQHQFQPQIQHQHQHQAQPQYVNPINNLQMQQQQYPTSRVRRY